MESVLVLGFTTNRNRFSIVSSRGLFFLKDKVKTDIIDEFAELMLQNKDIKCIHFTDQSVLASDKSEFEHLYDIQKKQKYRVSCQAALWRKGELFELLRIREDA